MSVTETIEETDMCIDLIHGSTSFLSKIPHFMISNKMLKEIKPKTTEE
jgi:hypothetical protein